MDTKKEVAIILASYSKKSEFKPHHGQMGIQIQLIIEMLNKKLLSMGTKRKHIKLEGSLDFKFIVNMKKIIKGLTVQSTVHCPLHEHQWICVNVG